MSMLEGATREGLKTRMLQTPAIDGVVEVTGGTLQWLGSAQSFPG